MPILLVRKTLFQLSVVVFILKFDSQITPLKHYLFEPWTLKNYIKYIISGERVNGILSGKLKLHNSCYHTSIQ